MAVVGGRSAGLAAAIALARSRRTVVVVDAGRPRNAPAEGAHNVLGQEGIPPREAPREGPGGSRVVQRGSSPATQPRSRAASTASPSMSIAARTGCRRAGSSSRLALRTISPAFPAWPRMGRSVLHCPFCHGWEVRDQRVAILARDAVALHQAVLFRQLSDRVTVFLHDAHDPTVDEQEQLAALDVAVVRPEVEHLVMDGSQVRGRGDHWTAASSTCPAWWSSCLGSTPARRCTSRSVG